MKQEVSCTVILPLTKLVSLICPYAPWVILQHSYTFTILRIPQATICYQMGRLPCSVFVFLGENLLTDHSHCFGKGDDEYTLPTLIVCDANDNAGSDARVDTRVVNWAVVVLNAQPATLIQTV